MAGGDPPPNGFGLLVSDVALDVMFQSSVLFLCLISAYMCFRTFQDQLHIKKAGSMPGLQICSLRIVAIAPTYALLTWLKLMLTPLFPIWKTFQEFGEAYSIFCYWVLLVLWCGGQKRTIEALEDQSSRGNNLSLCPLLGIYLPGWSCPIYSFSTPKSKFKFWRMSMTQLIVVRCAKVFLLVLLALPGRKFAYKLIFGRLLHLMSLASISLAMHCIMETYVALRPKLAHFQAERKFLCIKVLVLIALIQPLLTNALETIGAFPDDVVYGYSDIKWNERLLGTVSVIQMVLFSLLLSFAFSLRYTLEAEDADQHGVALLVNPRQSQAGGSERASGSEASPGYSDFLRIWDFIFEDIEEWRNGSDKSPHDSDRDLELNQLFKSSISSVSSK